MSLTPPDYDRAIADLTDLQQIPGVAALPELAQFSGAVKALAPATPTVRLTALNLAHLLCPVLQFIGGQGYERDEHHFVVTTNSFTLDFQSLVNGIVAGPLLSPGYEIRIDGVARGIYQRIGTETKPRVNVTLGNEGDGPHVLEIVGSAGESNAPWGIYIDRLGKAKDHPMMWRKTESYEWGHDRRTIHVLALVPKHDAIATPRPLRVAPFTPFATAVPRNQLFRENYAAPVEQGNYGYPVTTLRGIQCSENKQGYFVDAYAQIRPYHPLMDGGFGVATFFHTLYLEWGRNNKLRGSSPYAWWEVDSTGQKQTFFGLRHKWAPYWEEAEVPPPGYINANTARLTHPALEIVGEEAWDASVPRLERWPRKSWFSFFDDQTTTVDPNSPLVGTPPEHTHASDPVAYVFDGHGWCLRAQFDHTAPPDAPRIPIKITRHFALVDPFKGALDGHVLYAAERSAHRISMWDFRAGTYLGDFLVNPAGKAYGAVDPLSDRWEGATIPGPNGGGYEGIAIMDDWLYYTSRAMGGGVWRKSRVTGEQQFCCTHPISGAQPHFVNLAVSDGTTGPRHTVFTWSFDNQYFGRPRAWLPVAGTDRTGRACTHTSERPYPGFPGSWLNDAVWDWHAYSNDQSWGRGGATLAGVYPLACAVGGKSPAIAVGGTDGGLQVFRQVEPTDPPAPNAAALAAGHREFRDLGGNELYGHFGHGGRALPWGRSANLDAFFTGQGHSKP